jgi:hypothetical protein
MNRFTVASMNIGDMLGDLGAAGDALDQQRQLASVPHYLKRQLLFPYTQGLEFTCALERDGDWRAIDRVYDRLPTTSAQVLWPERYRDGEGAKNAPDPAAPGRDGARRVVTFGAADLPFLFEAPGDDTDAALTTPPIAAVRGRGETYPSSPTATATQSQRSRLCNARASGPLRLDEPVVPRAVPGRDPPNRWWAALLTTAPRQDAVISRAAAREVASRDAATARPSSPAS